MIRIALEGASGRMGQHIENLLKTDSLFTKKTKLVYSNSRFDGDALQRLKNSKADVVIDFSSVKNSIELSKACAKLKLPLLLCTTGFSKSEKTALKNRLKNNRWIHIPNTSLGVFLLCESLLKIAPFLDKARHKINIVESHHVHKLDSPSGTALLLKEVIQQIHPKWNIPITSIREGEIVGIHSIQIEDEDEILTLTHKALSRKLFASGALRLAMALAKSKRAPITKSNLFLKALT